MTADNDLTKVEVDRLKKRLDRERKAREESEAINERALSQLYRKQNEVKLLQMIAIAANQTSAVEDAMQISLDRVCAHTGWPVGHVYLVETESTMELVPTALWHFENPGRFGTFKKVTEGTCFKPGIGLPGRVLSSKEPTWIVDVTKDPNFPRAKAAEDSGVRAAFGFPVLIGTEVAAVLEFFSEVPQEPDEPLLEIMGHVGTQLGRVIERKRAQETLLMNNTRLEEALCSNLALCEDLKRQQAQLQIADRHKSQFLANMSHELRTPLNAVLGYTELIVNNIYGEVPEKIKEVLTRVQNSGRHLLNLINDILDLSKIEAGQFSLSLSEYSLKEVVGLVLASLEPLATEKKLVIKTSVPPELPSGKGDERRIQQILMNLVGNAIKFTEAGEVRVDITSQIDEFHVSVSDTGPGIPVAEQKRIFEEFQQVDGTITKEKGGTGLGLSIVKHLVTTHGGRIGVNSIPGQGSTFWFALPIQVSKQVDFHEQTNSGN